MDRSPEERRALAYLEHKGSRASAAEVRDRVGRALAAIEGQLAEIDAETARRRPAGGGWCPQEVVDHLLESHRPGLEQLRLLLAGRSPEGGPIPASLLSADPLATSWETKLGELEALHRSFLELLEGASDETPLEARAPLLMVVKVQRTGGGHELKEWVEPVSWKAFAVALAAHTREHQSQIARALQG